MKWIRKRVAKERRDLERARVRFVRKPNDKRLHDVRTKGRRFRSLLEDVECIAAAHNLLERVKHAAEITDAARNATVLLALLERSVESGEAQAAAGLLASLREREKEALRCAHQRLRKARFEKD